MKKSTTSPLRIAVTGATGYIGGRLVPLLLKRGHRVTVLTRSATKLRDSPWREQVEVVEGSLEDRDAVKALIADTDVLYYLVHSMAGKSDFEEHEKQCATNVAKAAEQSDLKRIVYLSGLHPDGELSRHLRSRTEVGNILADSGVETAILQAGLVIGSGSASFEMIRHLTDVLPAMPAPRWVNNRIQPIAIRDALFYLVNAAEVKPPFSGAFDIGGPDVLTYAEMMKGYARVAGLREPFVLALPVLTPALAAQWVNLVTPIPRKLAIPLVESLQHDCVVRDTAIDEYIPKPPEGLVTYERSVELALKKIEGDLVETTWATAQPVQQPASSLPSDPEWTGKTVYTDERSKASPVDPKRIWHSIESIGGENGWYSWALGWTLRGFFDKVVGGVGLHRGRRSRDHLVINDVVDWWRVEEIIPGEYLRLRAEMRVPGDAWLEFWVTPSRVRNRHGEVAGGSVYRQRAVFFPQGLSGRLYWLAVLPFHGFIFSGMVNQITSKTDQQDGSVSS